MLNRVTRALVLAAMYALAMPGQAVPILTVGSATKNVGNIFTIPVSIAGAVNLTSFQFDLSFNAAVLKVTLTGVTENLFFTQGDITVFIAGAVDNTLGTILGVSDSLILQTPVNGSGILANIEFEALAAGTSPLTLSNVFLNLLDSGFSVTNGSVCVNGAVVCGSAVPVPGTLTLLALGFGVLGLRRRFTQGALPAGS